MTGAIDFVPEGKRLGVAHPDKGVMDGTIKLCIEGCKPCRQFRFDVRDAVEDEKKVAALLEAEAYAEDVLCAFLSGCDSVEIVETELTEEEARVAARFAPTMVAPEKQGPILRAGESFADLAIEIVHNVADSRERALALTHLEEASRWVIRALALELAKS